MHSTSFATIRIAVDDLLYFVAHVFYIVVMIWGMAIMAKALIKGCN